MQFSRQVLPAPLGPMIARISLSRTSTLISVKDLTPPKDRERFCILILTLFDVVTSCSLIRRVFQSVYHTGYLYIQASCPVFCPVLSVPRLPLWSVWCTCGCRCILRSRLD